MNLTFPMMKRIQLKNKLRITLPHLASTGCGTCNISGVFYLEQLDYKLEYNSVADKSDGYTVIIVAAGNSVRMKGISKQFLSLCGIPVIARTLLAFENNRYINRIILVTKSEYIADMQYIGDKYLVTKLSDIVAGGNTRQESVVNGLNMLGDEEFVLIHDGARPLVTDKVISNVCNAINTDTKAVICGIKITDTVKKVNNGLVEKTIDRSDLIRVQTPQAVNVAIYKQAIENTDVAVFTDDSSIMESAGHSVTVVDGDMRNIKITTPADIMLAEYFIKNSGDTE